MLELFNGKDSSKADEIIALIGLPKSEERKKWARENFESIITEKLVRGSIKSNSRYRYNNPDYDDLKQNVLLFAHEALLQYDPVRGPLINIIMIKIKQAIYRYIIANRSKGFFKSALPKEERGKFDNTIVVSTDVAILVANQKYSRELSPDEQEINSEHRRILDRYLSEISPRDRDMLEYRLVDKMPFETIRQILIEKYKLSDIGVKFMSTRIKSLLKKLRKKMVRDNYTKENFIYVK